MEDRQWLADFFPTEAGFTCCRYRKEVRHADRLGHKQERSQRCMEKGKRRLEGGLQEESRSLAPGGFFLIAGYHLLTEATIIFSDVCNIVGLLEKSPMISGQRSGNMQNLQKCRHQLQQQVVFNMACNKNKRQICTQDSSISEIEQQLECHRCSSKQVMVPSPR